MVEVSLVIGLEGVVASLTDTVSSAHDRFEGMALALLGVCPGCLRTSSGCAGDDRLLLYWLDAPSGELMIAALAACLCRAFSSPKRCLVSIVVLLQCYGVHVLYKWMGVSGLIYRGSRNGGGFVGNSWADLSLDVERMGWREVSEAVPGWAMWLGVIRMATVTVTVTVWRVDRRRTFACSSWELSVSTEREDVAQCPG